MVPSVVDVEGNFRYKVWDWLDAKFWHTPSVLLMCKSTHETAIHAEL
jgi:hypothetical protein